MKEINYSVILKRDKLAGPLLIWSEADKQSSIYLAASSDSVKRIHNIKNHNISSLLLELEGLMGSDNFIKTQAIGDAATYPFKLQSLQDDLSWDKLIKEFSELVNKPQAKKEFDDKLNAALQTYYQADIAAAALECVYNSIIYYMIVTAQELGITKIAFIGDITYQERFAQLLHKNLPEDIEAHFSDI